MPATPAIDLRQIRMHHSDRRIGFEELVRQLLIASPPENCAELEHKGPGADGGAEVLVRRTDGRTWGYQTKYFVDGFAAAQINQLWSSFRSALAAYPTLDRYFIVLPVNLAGGVKGGALSQRQKWEAFRVAAEAEAAEAHRSIAIELWDESRLVSMLSGHDPVHAGMRLYWFDALTLTPTWLSERFSTAAADLGERYHPLEHVKVTAETALEIVARGPGFTKAFANHLERYQTLLGLIDRLDGTATSPLAAIDLVDLARRLSAARESALALSGRTLGSIDITPTERLIEEARNHPAAGALRDLTRISREASSEEQVRRREIENLLRQLDSLPSSLRRIGAVLLKEQRLLLIGEAGAGKSHSLADLVSRHLDASAPAVLLLGQHFLDGEPRSQMMSRLGLGALPFDTFLGALQAAAHAAGKPGLIVIDALNESRAPRLWQANLAGLARDIARFDALALVVSCRETYETACIPSGLELARYVHQGFGGDGAAAAKAYLDRNGIDRPAAPFLSAEFTNPLFLSTSVRRLRAAGKQAFPPGLVGTSEVFGFWLEGVEASLLSKGFARIREGDGRLRRAIGKFADELALARRDDLPLSQATKVLESEVSAFSTTGPDDQLVWRLIDEGVLRREPDNGSGEETVAFTFQRFSDHFVAEALLRLCDTPKGLAQAMRPDGFLSHLLDEDDWQFEGIVEALMIQVPERFNVELPELEPGFAKDVALSESAFLASLRWRSTTAVTDRTVALFEKLWDAAPDRSDLVDLLFQVCSIPGHALNGDYLNARLALLPLAERDALLGAYFTEHEEDGPLETLIEWLMEARLDLAEHARVRLAATAAGWFLTASSRTIRDRASRALTSAFLKRPELMAPLIIAFGDVDDAYVRERILGAAAAAATHLDKAREAVGSAALAAWTTIFGKTVVERHVFVRHYARILVETAASRNWLPSAVAIERCRPPYASAPITDWPTSEAVTLLLEDASAIRSSVLGYRDEKTGRYSMPGDFGKYAMGGIGADFAADRRTDYSAPRTKGLVRSAFWRSLAEREGEIPSLAQAALDAHSAREALREDSWSEYFDRAKADRRPGARRDKTNEKTLDAQLEKAEDALIKASAIDPRDLQYRGHDDDQIVLFRNETARRWVAWRAMDFGWRADLHAEIERNSDYSRGRSEHGIERVGKKYQWIAYHELLGALADHYWHVADRDTPSILGDVLQVEELDIDLSFFPERASPAPSGLPRLELLETDFSTPPTAEDAVEWAQKLCDLPDVPAFIEGASETGARWWAISGAQRDKGYLQKLQRKGPMRTAQGFVQMIVVASDDVARLHKQHSANAIDVGDMLDHDYSRSPMFGQQRRGLIQPQPILDRSINGIEFGLATHRFTPYRGEYDFGGGADQAFEIPRPWLIDLLDLRPAGPHSPWFVDAAGQVAFVDPEAFGDKAAGAMINADLLEPALAAHKLSAAWIYWGEKDGGDGSDEHSGGRRNLFARETYCGLWWRNGPNWRGSMWRASDSRPHVAFGQDTDDEDEKD